MVIGGWMLRVPYLKINLLCPQVHCMALVQGVQEGGEMSGPLPHEERQQFERILLAVASENTEEFGSFCFSFSFLLLRRDAEGKQRTTEATHLSSS